MTKNQLLVKSRELGLDIVQLINEYRNSMGEYADHDEAYFSDYFAGILVWLCTGSGKIKLEYTPAQDKNQEAFIDGSVTVETNVRYLFNDAHIHDFKTLSETTTLKEGKIDKEFTMKMDPITFLYFVMGTTYGGSKIFDGSTITSKAI